jgi:enamine deaminase RidA (YjgF/YER057c/UK114 family)
MAVKAEAAILERGIVLPALTKPGGNFVTTVTCGRLLFTAGHGPVRDGSVPTSGVVGEDLDVEAAYKVARSVGLNVLSSVRQALGTLDRVDRVVKVLGMVRATAGFTDHPKVVNGFSDLMVEVFGDAGRHARSAVGMASLPNGIPVEIEAIFEIRLKRIRELSRPV